MFKFLTSVEFLVVKILVWPLRHCMVALVYAVCP